MSAVAEESKTDELEQDAEIQGGDDKSQQQDEDKEKTGAETAEMRKAIADLARAQAEASRPKDDKKELTQDEINELWAVYDPKKTKADFMKKFFRLNDDATPEQEKEAEALFYEMRDGITKQAVTGARHFMAIELDKMAKKFDPILQYVDKRQTEDLRERFFKGYESLADPKYKTIIDLQAKILKDKKFETEDDYFKALAEGAAENISAATGSPFDLGKKPEKKPAATTPKLPRTTVGGGSSAGGGGSTKGDDKPGGNIDELD